jgi:phage shock protein A
MNLFDRFARVAKSNLNDLANKLEDPAKIMDQAIEEMQVSCVSRSFLLFAQN